MPAGKFVLCATAQPVFMSRTIRFGSGQAFEWMKSDPFTWGGLSTLLADVLTAMNVSAFVPWRYPLV